MVGYTNMYVLVPLLLGESLSGPKEKGKMKRKTNGVCFMIQ